MLHSGYKFVSEYIRVTTSAQSTSQHRLRRPNERILSLRRRSSRVRRRRDVAATTSPVDVDVLAGPELLTLEAGHDLEGVCTEVVTLCLDQVRGDNLRAVAVEERERGREGRCRDTPEDGLRDDTAPAGLCLGYG